MGIIRLSKEGEPLRYVRHPLVYLVEAADDICYEIMDLEDAHKLKIITFEEASRLMLDFFDEMTQNHILERIENEQLFDENEKIVYLRACVIGKLENECVNAFVEHEDEILAGTFTGSLIDHISPMQRDAYRRCADLSVKRIYRSRPVLDVELSGYKIMETLMQQMVEAVIHLMAVIDYISGMTDVYALDVYQKINGISLPII